MATVNLIKEYQRNFRELKPYALPIWGLWFFAVACGGCAFLLPTAGFFHALLKLRRDERHPTFMDAIEELDQIIPLFILWSIALGLLLSVTLFSLFFLLWSAVLSQLSRLLFLGVFLPFFIPFVVYAVLLVVDQRYDALTAAQRAYWGLRKNLQKNYLLGLGTVIVSLPCLLGTPLGYWSLIKAYERQFPRA